MLCVGHAAWADAEPQLQPPAAAAESLAPESEPLEEGEVDFFGRSHGRAENCIERDSAGRFLGWMDYQHCVFSGRATSTARWFDDLFGDWYDDEASMLVRTIGDITWDEEGGTSAGFRLRASVNLPNASRKLRLVVSDDQTESGVDQSLRPGDRNAGKTTAAIRFIPVALERMRIDTDIGLRSGPDIFIRARYRESWNLAPRYALRLGQTLRYAADDKGRANTQLDLERAIGDNSVARLGNALSYWEKEDHAVGARWGQGLSLSHSLGEQRSLAYGLGTDGVTRPKFSRESYGLWLVFRSNIWRPWLFYELEPRLTRYRSLDWDAVPSMTLRLEAQFGRD